MPRIHCTRENLLYYLSLALIAAAISVTLLSLSNSRIGIDSMMFFILSGFALYAASGTFDRDEGRKKLPRPWSAMDLFLLTLRLLSIPAAIFIFAFGMGGAEIIEGQYCLTSHGEITAYISEGQYQLHKLCKQMVFPTCFLPFLVDAAIQCRAQRTLQKN